MINRKIIYISGGQRSGKSAFAQSLAEKLSETPIYLATARIWDDDFRDRVKKHQKARNDRWTTIEEEKSLSNIKVSGSTVLMDCVTLWLTNIFFDNRYDLSSSLEEAKREWASFTNQTFTLIVVSNELGMGIHPIDENTRHFADLHGEINQYISSMANEAYLLVSGRPLQLK